MTIWTLSFWKSLAERVISTLVAALIGQITSEGFDFTHANWKAIGIAVGIASLVSFLKGILANLATQDGPSLSHAEQVVPSLPAPAES
jgi:hypothetical protein